MVDFYEVHGKAVDAAKGKIRQWEIWNVAVREPLHKIGDTPSNMEIIIRYRALPDGRLEPAEPRDEHEISEWNKRHRNTPREAFHLPGLWVARS